MGKSRHRFSCFLGGAYVGVAGACYGVKAVVLARYFFGGSSESQATRTNEFRLRHCTFPTFGMLAKSRSAVFAAHTLGEFVATISGKLHSFVCPQTEAPASYSPSYLAPEARPCPFGENPSQAN